MKPVDKKFFEKSWALQHEAVNVEDMMLVIKKKVKEDKWTKNYLYAPRVELNKSHDKVKNTEG